MNSDLQQLMALQQADAEISRLQEEIAKLPKHLAETEHRLADTRAAVEKEKAAITANQLNRRNLEKEIQSQHEKISKYREQSLSVKTNDQYKALMHEIEFAEKNIKASEDKILEEMEALEAIEKTLKQHEVQLKAETAEVEKEKAEVRARTAEDQKQLDELMAKRKGLREGITEATLAHYDRIIKVRKTAISEARGQICLACNVMLRPQTYSELRNADKLITCDSCSRILYYDPANEPPKPPEKKPKKKKAVVEEESIEPISEETEVKSEI